MSDAPVETTRSPTLSEVIQSHIEQRLAGLHVAIPASVQSYDATAQRVTVQPLLQRGYRGEDGNRAVERLPVITDVPVCFPGSGPYSITFPLAAGDTVLLVFSESSLDRWLKTGGELDPGDDRRFAMSDAIAIPGLRDFAHALPSAAVDAGAAVVSAPAIKLGDSSASSPAALNDEFSAFVSIFSSWTPVSGDGGAALQTAITTYLSAHSGFPVGATKVKVK